MSPAGRRLQHATPKIIFVICILAVASRLIFINHLTSITGAGGKSDVAAIALEFFANGFRFGYPQIDWAGNAPVMSEQNFQFCPSSRRFYLQVCRCARMDRANSGGYFVRGFVAIFFFFSARSRDLWKHSSVWATFFYCFSH